MLRKSWGGAAIALLALALVAPSVALADNIVGDDGANDLRGTSGKDRIVGKGGNDFLSGLAGKDLIQGGPGNDILSGGSHADRLYGGDGRDRLNGGSGDDLLVGGPGADILMGGSGNDVIEAAGDGSRDTVNCGEGNADRAVVDPGDTVVWCETVKVVLP